MPKKGRLDEFEVAVLLVLYEMSSGASTGHFPAEAISSKFRSHVRGDVKEALAELARNPKGYIFMKPTGGAMTYAISQRGRGKLMELKLV